MNLLERLHSALDALGIPKYGRNKHLADITGYSYPQISALLSGKAILNDRFVKLLCAKLMISEKWLKNGEGEPIQLPVLAAEEMISYNGFPEPVQKTIELMMVNINRAWELYAVLLERVEKMKNEER